MHGEGTCFLCFIFSHEKYVIALAIHISLSNAYKPGNSNVSELKCCFTCDFKFARKIKFKIHI